MAGERTPAPPARRTDYRCRRFQVRPRRPPSRITFAGGALPVVAFVAVVLVQFSNSQTVALPDTTMQQLDPTIGTVDHEYNVSKDEFDASMPASGATISLEPQALPLTSHLAEEDLTAAASAGGHPAAGDASLQLLPSSSPSENLDGRRRRRLGRKRKRRPLQDDYWPPAAEGTGSSRLQGDDNNDGESPTGRLSERKRLPYAGAAASRWEGTNKLPSGHVRQGALRQVHHHPQRANDWMHNPYTDAVNVEQQGAVPARRPVAVATGGNFSPIDPNRSRRIPGNGRAAAAAASEPPPAVATGNNPKAYRKPYSQARRSEEQFSSSDGSAELAGSRGPGATSSAADLKALLKQSDGLSLSEILQQRNISLQDLIKGKQMALAALTQSPLEVSTVSPVEDTESTTVSPTLASVRFRVYDEPEPRTTTTTMATTTTTMTTTDSSSSAKPPPPEATAPEDETNNSVDELDGQGVSSIFPTVEIKQLALNPVLPILKEERLRPIKGVASRIRPDLSNTHIRTSEPDRFQPARSSPPANGKRLPSAPSASFTSPMGDDSTGSTTSVPPTNPTVPSLLLITSTARERWTPSATLRHREHKWQAGSLPGINSSKPSKHGSPGTGEPTGTTSESPTAGELVGRLTSAEATSMLPEAEAMVELAPERPHHQQLLRVPKLKARIAIKPRLPNVVPPTAALSTSATSSTTTAATPNSSASDRFNLSDVELSDDETYEKPRRQQRLHEDEQPELNIIEKFTSFASEPSGSEQEQRSEADREQEQEMADLIGRISEHTQRSFTDSLEELYRDVTESNPSLFNDLSPIASSDDRRELLELMEDRRIGSRLAKVLSQRNMTLEQLLEHRRRGSSQLHLAEIANGKVKPMIDDKIDIVTAFEHFPRFNIGNLRSIRPDDIKLDSQGFSYFTSIINLRPAEGGGGGGGGGPFKEARALQARHRAAATANHRNEAHFLAPGGSKDRLLVPSRMSATGSYASSNDNGNGYEDPRLNGLEHDLLDMELSGHGFQHHRSASVTIESTSIPVGVRSAIVASSAIVGVSLAIFIAIFVTCRLRQRRRQKLNYTENFHMAKGRLPIISAELEARNSGSSTVPSRPGSGLGEQQQIVYTTHRALGSSGGSGHSSSSGRQQQSAPMDPNSVDVQDYLWDRKPFQ